MAGPAVRIEGLADFSRDLRAFGKEGIRGLREGLKRGAEAVRGTAETEAPRDSGALARSLKVGASTSVRRPRAFVRSTKPYAGLIHYGGQFQRGPSGFIRVPHTVRYTPNPFINRAMEKREEAVLDAVSEGLEQALAILSKGA